MNGFLLDTHTFIWAAQEAEELPQRIDDLLKDRGNLRYVSAVTAWEIATKARIGKLDEQIAHEFYPYLKRAGYIELPVSIRHGSTAGAFIEAHKDPFDRILAAQTLHESLTLLSNDSKLDAFGIHRVW